MQKSSTPTTTSTGGSSKAEQVVSKAMAYVNRGNPYAYGGSGQALTTENINSLANQFKNNSDAHYDHLRPGGNDYHKVGQSGMECVDCSGLTKKVFGSVGVSIPRTASEQYNCGQDIGVQNAQPGDLIVRQGHAAVMGSGGKMIEAKGWKWGCTHDRKPGNDYKAIRLVSGGSNVTGGTTTGGTTTGGTTTTGGSVSFDVTSAVNYNKKRGYSKSEWKMIQQVIGTEADGIPGKNTATALYQWQLSRGLEADGKCGPATYAAIQSAHSNATAPSTPAPSAPSTSTTEGSSPSTESTTPAAPTTTPAAPATVNFDVTSAVNYNQKRGYSKSEWKMIQQVVGTDADGIPGKNTAKAIAAWQQSHGLEVDGKCGPATLKSMNLNDNTQTSGGSGDTDMSQYQGGTGPGYPETATWNQHPIYNYFVNEVYADHPAKKAIAAGFLGNIYTESHYQQDAEQCKGSKNSGGKGIIQWDNRKHDLYAFCGSNYTDRKWVDLSKQLAFAKHELNGTEKSADKAIRNSVSTDSAENARKAAHVIAKKFERPANPDNPERQNKAEENYHKFA